MEGKELLEKLFPAGLAKEEGRIAWHIAKKNGFLDHCGGDIILVDVNHIKPCQSMLAEHKLESIKRALENGEEFGPSIGVKFGDTFYLLDGHHRASARVSMGKKEIEMCVYEATQEEWDSAVEEQKKPREHHYRQTEKTHVHELTDDEKKAVDEERKKIKAAGGLREYLKQIAKHNIF